MDKIMQAVRSVYAYVVAFLHRKAVVRTAAALTASPLVLIGGTAHATDPADPLNGAGQDLATSLVGNFTTYVIPAVVSIILAVYAFKMIVKLGTRFLNRA